MKTFVLLTVLLGLAAAQSGRLDSRCPQGPNDPRPDRFAHPFDCSMFVRCHNGNALEFRCPNGQHWSERTNSCEEPHIARCQLQPIQQPHPQPIQPPRPQPIIPPPSTPTFLQCPAFDIPGEFVYFPHPNECSQFYQCSAGRAVLLRCPSGHLWNIERTFCDREQNVHCRLPRRL
ncbi:hypothetical protein PVAND_006883 [Polypedilum vanderplanki]|uniref:Chitin-binding type-2 domain-containing protein n=1 Tax=Polypedilum vanderplanki TaxID=319348 RepID=A0A9J6C4J6_POLVA|nr:hypothetical protein PVAND_006883 [Polypedilum vanderplanki]